jgi:hypothetical protein
MSLNFNTSPYYDDFDQTKNFHRILFKPGVAVQARELTQSQTILQDQITKFADNIFKQNSPVTGGQVTTNFNCYYVKLQDTYANVNVDVSKFNGLLVTDATGTVLARVLAVAAATSGDAPTLVVSYLSGNHFTDNSVVYDTASNLAAQALTANSTGISSVASISQGVFYVLGNFVQIQPSTIILNKYSSSANARVGLTITETVEDYINDASLLDPAVGASNYQAPGADRYLISLTLSSRPLTLGDDQNFIELVRVTNGSVAKLVDGSVYNVIDDYFAKRDYETNGDYVVNDFKLTPKSYAGNSAKYTMSIGKGVAYVRGYRLENSTPVDLISDRARTTASQNNNPVFIDVGNYFYVNSTNGIFDVTTTANVDLHCVTVANVSTTNAATYSSTVVGSGYVRELIYDHNTIDAQSNTYVYRAYVNDIQTSSPSANVVAATTNTVTLPATYSAANNAYAGVNISIINGTDAGDFRTITSYNGVTKVATVNQNWSITPDATSVFSLNFGIKDTQIIVGATKTSYPATITASAIIDPESKANNTSTGLTVMQNGGAPEMLFRLGNPYVASLSGTTYTTQQLWRSVSFGLSSGSYTAQLSFTGGYLNVLRHIGTVGTTLSSNVVKQNFFIVVTSVGSGCKFNVGQVLTWTGASRTASLNSDGSVATLSVTSADAGGTFTASILEQVYAVNADNSGHLLKYKNLITANTTVINSSNTAVVTGVYVDDTTLTSTGQVYIQNSAIVSPGSKQNLYLSDIKTVVKIIDTGSPSLAPTPAMLSSAAYDVTANFNFDSGQRDSYYDHGSLTLRPGAPSIKGNMLVLVNYYQHAGGDGYFCVTSYLNSSLPDTYQSIPSYNAKDGMLYQLRDVIDFRPARKNAQTAFTYRLSTSDTMQGIYLPSDLSTFYGLYSYYLGRKDKLVLSKDRSLQIVQGNPSLSPILPAEPDGSLVIANLTHTPYTGYVPTEAPSGVVPDLSVEKVKHKRYTMQDIAGLETRINQIEYYTSLNALEQSATGLQIPDAYGVNRFKNGILVDDFSSYATTDTLNPDYNATINRRQRQLTAGQSVQNFPLKSSVLAYNMGLIYKTLGNYNLGFEFNSDGYVNYFSLPYTTANAASQVFASRTINVNPFGVSLTTGVTSLSPNVDNWVDTNYAPSLLITDPNLQVFRSSGNINVLTAGDWKTISGTTTTSSTGPVVGHNINPSPFGFVGYVATQTASTITQAQTNVLGPYDQIGNTYSLNNGYITDISVLPFIRPQQIVVRAKGMLLNTPVDCYFDNIKVNNYIRRANRIELTGVSGIFNEDDVIGYYSSNVFYPTARILGVYVYTGTNGTKVRLYVAADASSTSYTTNGIIQNGYFNTSGTYAANTAAGTLSSTTVHAGRFSNVSGNQVTLSPISSSTDIYSGNTIYVCAGTGAGQSATISSYNGTTKVATLSTTLSTANGDIYSIGSFTTNPDGAFHAVFNLPANSYHTGQRVFRVDNSYGNAGGAATTVAEGTFYSEGLQTTSQGIDFGASPSGAKGTFTQTNQQTTTNITTVYSPWDPVAQTFIFPKDNYPNGLFLNSISVFFASKPTSSDAPIKLSIVGTQNGYPNGQTLDHSVVILTPEAVNVSTAPQYLDKTASTVFKFSAPVYIQPGVLYAFMLQTSSTEYTLWSASNGDVALPSSVKNLPSDPSPSTITKIGSAPYVGALFLSQNSQTWTADQNQDLMFVIDRCVFNTSVTPTIQYVLPKKLPYRALVDQSLDYFLNANNVSSAISSFANTDVYVDAFNITTTDFTPTTTGINYSYNATLASTGLPAGTTNIIPGKFGTTTQDDIYLNDGNGERILLANTNQSFSLYAQLSTFDNAVSPIVSDAGLSVYAIRWNINNCELSNSVITLVNGGTGYSNNTTGNVTVSISAPTGTGGVQAYAAANVQNGNVVSVYVTSGGSGYIATPTITINDANTTPGSGANVSITGETSKTGGNALARYVTKKVVLDQGFDSGDLNVYLTAYRPVNTDINVYYKILNRNDTQRFEDSSWQLMTKINNSGTAYSQTRDNTIEYTFAPGTTGTDQGFVSYTSTTGQVYTTFSQFAIKVVLTSSDHTYVPYLTDIRALALPSNTNTTV